MRYRGLVMVLVAAALIIGTAAVALGKDYGKFTLLLADWGGTFDRPEENQPVKDAILKKFTKDTGNTVDFEIKFYPGQSYPEKLNIALAGGEEMDGFYMWYPYNGFLTYATKEGLVMPLDDLLKAYGPNLKKAIPDVNWQQVRMGGKILAIPDSHFPSSYTGFVRKDLLAKAGLGIPKTLAEFERALEVFRVQGKVPFTSPDFQMDRWLAGSFGLPYYDFVDTDGKVKWRTFHPNYPKYLETITRWYSKGWLPKDFLSITWQNVDEMFKSGKLASGILWYTSPGGWFKAMKQAEPGVDIVHLPILDAGIAGKGQPTEPGVKNVLFLMASSKNAAAAVAFYDWRLSKQENNLLVETGVPGMHYTVDWGKRVIQTMPKYLDPNVKGYGGTFGGNYYPALFPPLKPFTDDADTAKGNEISYNVRVALDAEKPLYSATASYPIAISKEGQDAQNAFNTEAAKMVAEFETGVRPLSAWPKARDELWKLFEPASVEYTKQLAALKK